MTGLRVALVLSALLLASCAAPPPVRVDAPAGVVRAADLDAAEAAAASLTRLLPRVRRLLGNTDTSAVELWIEAGLPHYPGGDHNLDGYALIGQAHAVLKTRDELGTLWEQMLAHELAHLSMAEGTSEALGFALTEALADVVALEAVADPTVREELEALWWINVVRGLKVGRATQFEYRIDDGARHIMLVRGETRVLCVGECDPIPASDWADWSQEPEASLWNVAVRGLASLSMQRVIDLHGWDELRARLDARTRGADPATWRARWLALAGLGRDPERWAVELLDRLDRDEVGRRVVHERHGDDVAAPEVLGMFRKWFMIDRHVDAELSFEAWLARRAPHIVLPEFAIEGDLRASPGLLVELREVWDAVGREPFWSQPTRSADAARNPAAAADADS